MDTGDFFKKIGREINNYHTQSVKIVDGYDFKQKERIDENWRFYHSKFKTGKVDSEGFEKFFENIVKNPCNTAYNTIKFDPDDIIISPAPGQSSIETWLMDLDFRYWLKESSFTEVLDRVFYELPILGSAVIKKRNNDFYNVDLRNFVCDPSADNLMQSNFVIERHFMSPQQVASMADKELWDSEACQEAIDEFQPDKEDYIRIYERYGYISESVVKEDGDPTNKVYSRVICAVPQSKYTEGQPSITQDQFGPQAGTILRADEIDKEDEFPYREFHFEKIPGRWLGVSRVEVLSDPQVRVNEITNLRVKSSYFSALNIFQTRDDNFKKNILKEIANGDVVTAYDQITRIPTEERNLAAFDREEQKWKEAAIQNTFAYDIARGERPPAGTPLGSAQMAQEAIDSYFSTIRKRVASQIKEVIYNDIIPMFCKRKEHYVKLAGEDLDRFKKYVVQKRTNKAVIDFVINEKAAPTQEQYDAIKMAVESKIKSEDVKIPDNFYKDIKYRVDITITGQEKDLRMQSANMSMILQTMQQDPEVLVDPTKKRIFSKLLESVGININDIDIGPDEEQKIKEKAREAKGGGISQAKIPQNVPPGMGGGPEQMEQI